jgi:DNA polymerase I
MIEAYQNDEDLHRLTAALIADKSLDQVEKSERQAAKAVNFGLIYAIWHGAMKRRLPKEMRTMGEACSPQSRGRLRRWQDEPKLTELLNTPVQGMEQAGQQYLRKVPVKAEVAIALSWAEK